MPKLKTTTKRKAISKKLESIENEVDRLNSKKTINLDEVGVDNDPEIDAPIHLQGGEWNWNFEKKPMSLVDKITWVLTAVNVAILISLVIKNI